MYLSATKYKIVFRVNEHCNPIDYVFLAGDNIHASAIIMPFTKMYDIIYILKYNSDVHKFEHVKDLEAKYAKK